MHLAEIASEYRRKADATLAPTTKRLLLENYQLNMRVMDMYDEIRLLRQQSVEWRAEDHRQVQHIRDLTAANAQITRKNITLAMVPVTCHGAYSFHLHLYLSSSCPLAHNASVQRRHSARLLATCLA